MNDRYASTTPKVAPNDIEWAFADGKPSIVVHIPDADGNYSVIALDQDAPSTDYEREMVRALLRIASRVMQDSERTSTNGAAR